MADQWVEDRTEVLRFLQRSRKTLDSLRFIWTKGLSSSQDIGNAIQIILQNGSILYMRYYCLSHFAKMPPVVRHAHCSPNPRPDQDSVRPQVQCQSPTKEVNKNLLLESKFFYVLTGRTISIVNDKVFGPLRNASKLSQVEIEFRARP